MSENIPVIVIDDTLIKRRGVCEFVDETPHLRLRGQAGDAEGAIKLVEALSQEQGSDMAGWLVLSDLRLGNENGIELGRTLLAMAPGLRVVIYTQDPSWTLAAEVFRREYTRRGTPRGQRSGKPSGLHGYALFENMEPGQRLTPRQEECVALIAQGLSNDDIAMRMGFFNAKGMPNIGPLENLVSELYNFFAIEGAPSDPGRRVLLAHAYEAYAGLRKEPMARD